MGRAPQTSSSLPAPNIVSLTVHTSVLPAATPSTTQATASVSPAFRDALMRHVQLLSPAERQAFNNGKSISPDELLAEIQRRDVRHAEASRSRKCLERVQRFFQAVEGYFKPVAVLVGHSPEFSSLVVGAVYLVVHVRWLVS